MSQLWYIATIEINPHDIYRYIDLLKSIQHAIIGSLQRRVG